MNNRNTYLSQVSQVTFIYIACNKLAQNEMNVTNHNGLL